MHYELITQSADSKEHARNLKNSVVTIAQYDHKEDLTWPDETCCDDCCVLPPSTFSDVCWCNSYHDCLTCDGRLFDWQQNTFAHIRWSARAYDIVMTPIYSLDRCSYFFECDYSKCLCDRPQRRSENPEAMAGFCCFCCCCPIIAQYASCAAVRISFATLGCITASLAGCAGGIYDFCYSPPSSPSMTRGDDYPHSLIKPIDKQIEDWLVTENLPAIIKFAKKERANICCLAGRQEEQRGIQVICLAAGYEGKLGPVKLDDRKRLIKELWRKGSVMEHSSDDAQFIPLCKALLSKSNDAEAMIKFLCLSMKAPLTKKSHLEEEKNIFFIQCFQLQNRWCYSSSILLWLYANYSNGILDREKTVRRAVYLKQYGDVQSTEVYSGWIRHQENSSWETFNLKNTNHPELQDLVKLDQEVDATKESIFDKDYIDFDLILHEGALTRHLEPKLILSLIGRYYGGFFSMPLERDIKEDTSKEAVLSQPCLSRASSQSKEYKTIRAAVITKRKKELAEQKRAEEAAREASGAGQTFMVA